MKLLLDYDSVTADTFVAQISALNDKFKKTYSLADFDVWKSEDRLKPEEAAFMWGPDCFLSPAFQKVVKPVDGSITTINKLHEYGFDFILATDRPQELSEPTLQWLKARGIYPELSVHFTYHPNSLSKEKHLDMLTKVQVIERYGLNMAIDDAPHHAEAFAEIPCIEEIFLLDMPYNQHIEGPKITRVFTWFDIFNKLYERYPDCFPDYRAMGTATGRISAETGLPVVNQIKTSGPLIGKRVGS